MLFDMKTAVTREEALNLLRGAWHFEPQTETVAIEAALGRIAAEDLYSRNTLPVCRASCFDGVAVRKADFLAGMPDTDGWKFGTDFVRADTGDDFDDRFDAVIAIENVILEGDNLRFRDGYVFDASEETVDPAGTIVSRDALVMPKNTKIGPQGLAVLAMSGLTEIPVKKKVRVGFIPTGSELVEIGTAPSRGQNIDANSIMFKALMESYGAEFVAHAIVADKKTQLEVALDEMLAKCDILVINGGSSKGEEDFNTAILAARADFFSYGVKCAHGKPVGMAVIDNKPVINIPGPVVSCYLAQHWLISALICHGYGIPNIIRPRVKATLTKDIRKKGRGNGMEIMTRVSLRKTSDGYSTTPINWDDDGLPRLLLNSDGFLNVPAGTSFLPTGAEVEIELIKPLEQVSGFASAAGVR